MSTVGIERDLCPSQSPDGDLCRRAADHLDPHRRNTEGPRWTGGVFRPAAKAAGYLHTQSAAHYSAWDPIGADR